MLQVGQSFSQAWLQVEVGQACHVENPENQVVALERSELIWE